MKSEGKVFLKKSDLPIKGSVLGPWGSGANHQDWGDEVMGEDLLCAPGKFSGVPLTDLGANSHDRIKVKAQKDSKYDPTASPPADRLSNTSRPTTAEVFQTFEELLGVNSQGFTVSVTPPRGSSYSRESEEQICLASRKLTPLPDQQLSLFGTQMGELQCHQVVTENIGADGQHFSRQKRSAGSDSGCVGDNITLHQEYVLKEQDVFPQNMALSPLPVKNKEQTFTPRSSEDQDPDMNAVLDLRSTEDWKCFCFIQHSTWLEHEFRYHQARASRLFEEISGASAYQATMMHIATALNDPAVSFQKKIFHQRATFGVLKLPYILAKMQHIFSAFTLVVLDFALAYVLYRIRSKMADSQFNAYIIVFLLAYFQDFRSPACLLALGFPLRIPYPLGSYLLSTTFAPPSDQQNSFGAQP